MKTLPSSSEIFSFPDWVNENAARTVAAGVVLLTSIYLLTGSGWVLALLAYGFVARVLSGPTLSPLGQLATRVLVPAFRLPDRQVPGPPKRFAQGIGAVLSLTGVALHLGGMTTVAMVVVGMITVAAFLEAALGFCLGCTIFGRLMAAGVLPESICVACNDISTRLAPASSR